MDRIEYGEHIQGWMNTWELEWLANMACRSDKIIEVGSWRGRSTTAIANFMRGQLWCVDAWQGLYGLNDTASKPYAEEAYSEFMNNMKRFIDADMLHVIKGDSISAADKLLEEHGPVFDFIFIDGDHTYDTVSREIIAYRRLMKPGGILSGHDNWMEGVARALTEQFPKGAVKAPAGGIWCVGV
jgi:predicted O-methyltransferase YrrM